MGENDIKNFKQVAIKTRQVWGTTCSQQEPFWVQVPRSQGLWPTWIQTMLEEYMYMNESCRTKHFWGFYFHFFLLCAYESNHKFIYVPKFSMPVVQKPTDQTTKWILDLNSKTETKVKT